jgi:hypothetical protein
VTSSSLPLPRLQRAKGEADPPVAYCCKVEHVVLNALAKQMQGRLIFASSVLRRTSSSPPLPRLRRARGEADPPVGRKLASFAREFPH